MINGLLFVGKIQVSRRLQAFSHSGNMTLRKTAIQFRELGPLQPLPGGRVFCPFIEHQLRRIELRGRRCRVDRGDF